MKSGIRILGTAALVGTVGAAVYVFARDDATVTRGRALYEANCASCHGANLEGQPDWQGPGPDGRYPAPPHDASGHTWHHSDADLIAYITLGGEAALAQMGVRFDSAMPAFGDALSQQDIEDILAYIKSRWSESERAVQSERSRANE